jgi:uncharacterized YigZ family protein
MNTKKKTYRTILKPAIGEIYKEKSSKFIGFVFPISLETEIKIHLENLKKQHAKARHWCYAWQLGVDKIQYRTNDNGEPNNSAGKPIYGQILSNDLTNVLVVVVRYYGGTKLGVGGLVSAYKIAAKTAIANAKISTKKVVKNVGITFEYKDINVVMRLINDFNATIIDKKMELNCYYQLEIELAKFKVFIHKIGSYKNIQINWD